MNTIQRATDLAAERNISIYGLAKLSEVSYSTLRTATIRNADLTIDVIKRVCQALDISVAEFFSVFK